LLKRLNFVLNQERNLNKHLQIVMSRNYPRFLLSDPLHTKSKGPFIIHTLQPQLIAKVTIGEDGYHWIDALEVFSPVPKTEVDNVVCAMHDWYTGQRMKNAKLKEDYFDRMHFIFTKLRSYEFFDRLTHAMIYLPEIGSKIEASKSDWSLSVRLYDNDNFDSVVKKLKEQFEQQFLTKPEWPF
jgi:hypothetical protein